jgi:hypothetical protein
VNIITSLKKGFEYLKKGIEYLYVPASPGATSRGFDLFQYRGFPPRGKPAPIQSEYFKGIKNEIYYNPHNAPGKGRG